MFLAWKEVKFNKGKFLLIISLIVLISYLVYFLSALAYGLATSYTNGIDKINANYLILSEDSNDNVMMSMLRDDDFNNLEIDGKKAKLGLFPAIIMKYQNMNLLETKEEVYVFGVENIEFFITNEKQNISLGAEEVILDKSVEKLGYKIGDEISISGTEIKWKIVAFVEKATYQTAPIMYVSLQDWQNYRFSREDINLYNAIWVKGEIRKIPDNLLPYTIKEYVTTLPGYTAQVLTFSLMIGFLIVIIAFVLGIFIYVLTIQKTNIFGVMKAQGVSSTYIGFSVISQTLLIVLFGSLIGFILTIISGIALSGIVPFANNIIFYLIITLAFFVFSTIGALFSYSTVVKIDPVKAIG